MINKTGRIYILISIFFSGMTVLALEIISSRLAAPYFGGSTFVWANLIGFTLLFLTAGYYVGGITADKKPELKNYAFLLASASLYTIAVLFFYNSFLSYVSYRLPYVPALILCVFFLMAVPITLLGCASPYAIRLLTACKEDSGRSAGLVYAVSTLGGILGAILPVVLFIPWIGSRLTLLLINFILFLAGIAGLKSGWMFLAFIAVLFAGSIWENAASVKNPSILYEKESSYALYKVKEDAQSVRYLHVNDSKSVYSVYNPNKLVVGSYLDLFLLAVYFQSPQQIDSMKDVLILGLGGGTSVRQFNLLFDDIHFTGVDIDPLLMDIGRQYFCLDAPNVDPVVMDARRFVNTSHKKFDVILIDLFIGDQIPPHLMTIEFFSEMKSILRPGGIIAANFPPEYGSYCPAAVEQLFKNSYYIRYVVAASDDEGFSMEQFEKNLAIIKDQELRDLGEGLLKQGQEIKKVKTQVPPITDDKVPVFWKKFGAKITVLY